MIDWSNTYTTSAVTSEDKPLSLDDLIALAERLPPVPPIPWKLEAGMCNGCGKRGETAEVREGPPGLIGGRVIANLCRPCREQLKRLFPVEVR